MTRGVVALAVPISLLAFACSSSLAARAAVTAPPPPAAAPAPDTSQASTVSPWSTGPVAAGAAERWAVAHNPTRLNPQPTARQGSDVPPSEETRFGSGDGLNLDPLGTCVSCTNASAGNNSSASESKELKVADESLSEGQGPPNGYNGGSMLSLPPNSLLGLALGYFQMNNRAEHGSSEAHSRGTLADARAGDGTLATLVIFQSRSDAQYSSAGGVHRSGSSSAVGAGLDGGRMAIVLLHSDSQSGGQGHVYLVQINDQQLATAEQLGANQPLNVPRVASISIFRSGPDGAAIGGVQDGSSNEAAGVVASSANSPGDQH